MIRKVIFSLLILHSVLLPAQTATGTRERTIHLELGGPGGFWSLSAEQNLGAHHWYLQAGISAMPTGKSIVFVVPVMLKKTFGEKANKLEAGIGQGLSLGIGDGVKFFPRGILEIGWRYQKENSPWIFRAMYSPLISYIVDLQYQHWGGIGIGYQLKSKS